MGNKNWKIKYSSWNYDYKSFISFMSHILALYVERFMYTVFYHLFGSNTLHTDKIHGFGQVDVY